LAESINWHNEKRRIKDIVPYVANPRQITDKQAKDLKASLAKFGLADPLIINTNNELIGGHQRKKILETLLGVDPDFEIDVRVPDRELSIDEARELNVRLNKNAGQWDFDILANNFELDDLLEWGFDKGELDLDLWAEDAPEDVEPQIDKAEELRVKWGVETGQLWQLGEHRLVCGDCTDKAVVERLLGNEKVNALFTDPPYGIDYDPQFLAEIAERHNKRLSSTNKVINDDGSLDLSFLFEFENRMIWGFPYIYDPNSTGWIVWDKQPGVEKRGIVTPIEVASTTMRKGFDMIRVMWGGFYRAAGEDKQPHPTQKPLGVYMPFIESWTKVGDVIYDPFTGSAPVLICCERLGRKCRAVEISPAYVAVAIQRWVDVTGQEPVLLANLPD